MDYDSLPRTADERTTLIAFLDWQRAVLTRKCDGLSDDELRDRTAPPSNLSLLGLVRHMANVERGWFRRTIAGEDIGPVYDGDTDFDSVDHGDSSAAILQWQEECNRARDIVAERSFDFTGHHRSGRDVSLRWVMIHMIEEYSRHNGHADLLRERIDGAVGY